MRILTDKECKRLLSAAATITGTVGPLEQRISALEAAAAGQPATAPYSALAARVAKLERVIAALVAAGSAA
jgi:hypothetical protein